MSNQRPAQKRNKRRRKNKNSTPKAGPQFWGDSSGLPEPKETVRITKDPASVVRSLGRAPVSGHETMAEHYFDAVYERSVALASALAAAGDLIDPDEL